MGAKDLYLGFVNSYSKKKKNFKKRPVQARSDFSSSPDLLSKNQFISRKVLQDVLQSTMTEIRETGTFPTLQKIAIEFKAEEAAQKIKTNKAIADTHRILKPRKTRKAQMVEILNRSVRKLASANKEKHEIDLELAGLMVGFVVDLILIG